MKPRVIFIHGNQAVSGWSFGFAPSLEAELRKRGYPTCFETFPDRIVARSAYWLPYLRDELHAGPEDVLVGWSSGAVAALRYAEQAVILGSVLISPSYTDLGDALEERSGYFTSPWDWLAIRAHQRHIALFHSDDDPYIPQDEFEHIAEQLNPHQRVVFPGQGHFVERAHFTEVADHLDSLYA